MLHFYISMLLYIRPSFFLPLAFTAMHCYCYKTSHLSKAGYRELLFTSLSQSRSGIGYNSWNFSVLHFNWNNKTCLVKRTLLILSTKRFQKNFWRGINGYTNIAYTCSYHAFQLHITASKIPVFQLTLKPSEVFLIFEAA